MRCGTGIRCGERHLLIAPISARIRPRCWSIRCRGRSPGLPATWRGAKDNTRDNEAMTTTHDRIDPSPRRCKAHSSRTGEPCKLPPVKGSNVCRSHGGAAPQVKAKARQRIEDAADRMARELLKMATDDHVVDSVKLSAIRDALDRAGLAAKNAVEVEVGPPKPYEAIFDSIEAGPRAEYRRSRGIRDDSNPPPALAEPPRELPAAEGEPIDAEIVGYQLPRKIHRHPTGGE